MESGGGIRYKGGICLKKKGVIIAFLPLLKKGLCYCPSISTKKKGTFLYLSFSAFLPLPKWKDLPKKRDLLKKKGSTEKEGSIKKGSATVLLLPPGRDPPSSFAKEGSAEKESAKEGSAKKRSVILLRQRGIRPGGICPGGICLRPPPLKWTDLPPPK